MQHSGDGSSRRGAAGLGAAKKYQWRAVSNPKSGGGSSVTEKVSHAESCAVEQKTWEPKGKEGWGSLEQIGWAQTEPLTGIIKQTGWESPEQTGWVQTEPLDGIIKQTEWDFVKPEKIIQTGWDSVEAENSNQAGWSSYSVKKSSPVDFVGEQSMVTEVSLYGTTLSVTVTNEAAIVQQWLSKQESKLFGFDIEWKPNFRGEDNSVALLQLCGAQGCILIQMMHLDVMPPLLVEFLLDSSQKMAGVGVDKDAEKLLVDHDLVCKGLVELGNLAADRLQNAALKKAGLKRLSKEIMGFEMHKPKSVQLSNWEHPHLSRSQIQYASADAWIAYIILQKLEAGET